MFNYVRSQAILKRKPSLQENLYSFESRNYNFISNKKFSSPELFGYAMAENFINRCCQSDRLQEVSDQNIAVTEVGLLKWLSKRTPDQIKALESDLKRPLDLEAEIRQFKLMVKSDAKVKLDSSSLVKHPPAQNIMFHRKAINAIFSPMFDEFKNRLIYVLNDNIKLYTEMDLETFGKLAGSILGFDNPYHVGEVDFSKFDKSQDKFIKSFERRVYSYFGFDPEMLDIWMQGEYESYAKTLDGQLAFTIRDQRKSGVANTWCGNSLTTLGILSLYYDIRKFKALFVSGDDSLIFSTKPISDRAETICLETGFETKFMTPSVPYFCSKFLCFTSNKTVFVPDPYKLVVKLGAPLETISVEYLMCLFESFKDLTKCYDDEVVVERLVDLVHSKYNYEDGSTKLGIGVIHCLRANFKSFRRLYPQVRGFMVVAHVSKYLRRVLPPFISSRLLTPLGSNIFLEFIEPS